MLAAFDLAVLVLVAWEYRRLRRELRADGAVRGTAAEGGQSGP
ncbi:hypothetical protein [Amnibacterium kyonggiense]